MYAQCWSLERARREAARHPDRSKRYLNFSYVLSPLRSIPRSSQFSSFLTPMRFDFTDDEEEIRLSHVLIVVVYRSKIRLFNSSIQIKREFIVSVANHFDVQALSRKKIKNPVVKQHFSNSAISLWWFENWNDSFSLSLFLCLQLIKF